ncbi:unnamed protein product [Ascophyllum nodosum]
MTPEAYPSHSHSPYDVQSQLLRQTATGSDDQKRSLLTLSRTSRRKKGVRFNWKACETMSGFRCHSQQAGRETFDVDIRYTNFEPIGDGSYGFVCSAYDNVIGKRVAVKKVKDMFRDLGDAKRILRELKLLRHFRPHENVVKIRDLMVYPQNSLDFRDVYIVTNLMDSDLQKVISSRQPLMDQHHYYFLYQLLRGLKYIHSANVLHRDLKPSNLVLDANCDLAICDFGLARGVEDESNETLTEYVQTRWYRAPELLCYASTYDTAVDMWSVGCIFAELLGRRPFFQGKNPMHQLQVIINVLGCPSEEDMSFITDRAARGVVLKHGRQAGVLRGAGGARPLAGYFPEDTNPLALDLLARMLVFNPKKRIGVEEALEHPYLGDLHAEMVGKEPVCHKLFDFDFEKERMVGCFNGSAHRKQQKLIPVGELKALVLEELTAYRPSTEAFTLLARARNAADEQRNRQLHASVSLALSLWSYQYKIISPVLSNQARLLPSSPIPSQVALGTPSPMDASIGPGMTTPTPGVHGYPGAMPYASAVPQRSGATSQPSRGMYQQPQHYQQQELSQAGDHYPRGHQGLPPQAPQRSRHPPFYQTQHPPGSSSSSRRNNASPAAVAAAVAAATAASSASASHGHTGVYPGMAGQSGGGTSAVMYPGFYYGQAFSDGALGAQQFYHRGDPRAGPGQAGAMDTEQHT